MSEIELNEKIYKALSDKKYDYRTPSGIAKNIGASIEDVSYVLKNYSDKFKEGPFMKNKEKVYCLNEKSEWSCIFDFFVCAR